MRGIVLIGWFFLLFKSYFLILGASIQDELGVPFFYKTAPVYGWYANTNKTNIEMTINITSDISWIKYMDCRLHIWFSVIRFILRLVHISSELTVMKLFP